MSTAFRKTNFLTLCTFCWITSHILIHIDIFDTTMLDARNNILKVPSTHLLCKIVCKLPNSVLNLFLEHILKNVGHGENLGTKIFIIKFITRVYICMWMRRVYIWMRMRTTHVEVSQGRLYSICVNCSAFAEAANRPHINVLNANFLWSTNSQWIVFTYLLNVRHPAGCCLPRLGIISTSNIHFIFACCIHIRVLFAFRYKPSVSLLFKLEILFKKVWPYKFVLDSASPYIPLELSLEAWWTNYLWIFMWPQTVIEYSWTNGVWIEVYQFTGYWSLNFDALSAIW